MRLKGAGLRIWIHLLRLSGIDRIMIQTGLQHSHHSMYAVSVWIVDLCGRIGPYEALRGVSK